MIQEGYYKNGFICAERKYVKYTKNESGQIQFQQSAKRCSNERTKFIGFYQFYNQNGRVIKEGYEKDCELYAEQKIYSHNQIQYAKMIARNVPLWY